MVARRGGRWCKGKVLGRSGHDPTGSRSTLPPIPICHHGSVLLFRVAGDPARSHPTGPPVLAIVSRMAMATIALAVSWEHRGGRTVLALAPCPPCA
jgi:hypothetical protein